MYRPQVQVPVCLQRVGTTWAAAGLFVAGVVTGAVAPSQLHFPSVMDRMADGELPLLESYLVPVLQCVHKVYCELCTAAVPLDARTGTVVTCRVRCCEAQCCLVPVHHCRGQQGAALGGTTAAVQSGACSLRLYKELGIHSAGTSPWWLLHGLCAALSANPTNQVLVHQVLCSGCRAEVLCPLHPSTAHA